MRLIAYSDSGITTTLTWSSNKTELKQSLLVAGQYNNDPYQTSWPVAHRQRVLCRPAGAYTAAGGIANGEPYAPTVIFMTDSVANSLMIDEDSWGYYDGKDICPGHPHPTGTASCMVGYMSDGRPRPISAMIEQGYLLKELATTYVIGLAGVQSRGLELVASADHAPTLFRPISLGISPWHWRRSRRISTTALVFLGEVMRGSIRSTMSIFALPPTPVPPSREVVGYIYLRNLQGQLLPGGHIPVRRDQQSYQLSYNIPDVVPGTYQMEAYVLYRGDDHVTRTGYPALRSEHCPE